MKKESGTTSQPPQVPDADHDVSSGDFFDPSPLSFDDHHIFQANRFRQGDLQPRQKAESVGRAAVPMTRPASPAEANRLTPNCRMLEKVISITEKATMLTTTMAVRRRT